MSATTDWSSLRREAERQGFRPKRTANGHWQFFAPDGHSVVTTGPESGDPRALKNFRAELRRAGFQDHAATTPLGEALRAAGVGAEEEEVTRPGASAREVVQQLLRRNPGGLSNEQLTDRLRVARPDLNDAAKSVYAATQALRAAGEIEPAGTLRGHWRTARGQPLDSAGGNVHCPGPEAFGQPSFPVPEPAPSGAGSGDAGVDADLQALDAALVTLSDVNEAMRAQFDRALEAFAAMETVVKRNREILLQTVKLKQVLNAMGSK